MISLAFYKGTGHIDDRVIRWVTRSAFSHVELLASPPTAGAGLAWSASGRDGGVRCKVITFHPDRWLFEPVPWAPANTFDRIRPELGKPYDYRGILFTQLFNLRRHSARRWFCSELCAYALGLAEPQEFSPGSLCRRVREMNRAFELGRRSAGEPPEDCPSPRWDAPANSNA